MPKVEHLLATPVVTAQRLRLAAAMLAAVMVEARVVALRPTMTMATSPMKMPLPLRLVVVRTPQVAARLPVETLAVEMPVAETLAVMLVARVVRLAVMLVAVVVQLRNQLRPILKTISMTAIRSRINKGTRDVVCGQACAREIEYSIRR